MKHESQTISPVCTAQTETGLDQRVNDYNNERRRLNTQYYTDVKGFAMGCSALFLIFSLRFFHFSAVYGSGPLIPLLAFRFIRISSPRLEHVQPSSDNTAHISHLYPVWGDGRNWCRPAFPRIGVLYSIYLISHYVAQHALSKVHNSHPSLFTSHHTVSSIYSPYNQRCILALPHSRILGRLFANTQKYFTDF
jgi:hypothetical protein